MSKITDVKIVQNEIVWALYTYPDGSEFCFQTTLNPTILNSMGIQLKPSCLPRIDKQYLEYGSMVYRSFPLAGVKVTFYTECHYTNNLSQQLHEFM